MESSLVFYTHPMSRGRTVRWMLEEIGQPYQTELLDFGTTMKAAEFLALNPMGKVPTICHDGMVVTETAAICAYLADAFPDAALAPFITDKLRGTYYRWLFFAAGPLESAIVNRAFGFTVPPEKEITIGYGNLPNVLNALEAALAQGDYILGSQFSAADVYVGALVGWAMQFNLLEKRPIYEDYHRRLKARPAAQRAREIDDALIAERAKA